MNRKSTVAAGIAIAILVVLIAAALVSGIGFGLEQIRRIFAALDPQAGIIVGVSCLTTLLSAWLIASAIRKAKRRELEARATAERSAIYEAVLDSLAGRGGNEVSENEATTREWALRLRASLPVLKEYDALLEVLGDDAAGADTVRSQSHRLLLSMRRDLGADTLGWEAAMDASRRRTEKPLVVSAPEPELVFRSRA